VDKDERQRIIVELVTEHGEVSTAELCERFDVSEMTIRRDLRELDQRNLLRRVFGGAESSLGRSYEPPYDVRLDRNREAKQAIGRKAAELISSGDSVAFDVGTTTLEIVRALRAAHGLTVLTSSLPIANELASCFSLDADVRLIITGGIVRSRELSLIGDIAKWTYQHFQVDKAFLGIGGLSLEKGLTEYNLEDASVKHSLLDSAREVIVVADGTKFGRVTFASVAPLSRIDTIVTDRTAPAELVEALRQMNIRVILAD
jgi:DeoR/GlpR family transcriptional regulator of sugar metabolism